MGILLRFPPMADDEPRTVYEDAFRERIRRARKAAGFTQKDVGEFLGIGTENYKKYEGRSPMPNYLLEKFCRLTHANPIYVLFGKHDIGILTHKSAEITKIKPETLKAKTSKV